MSWRTSWVPEAQWKLPEFLFDKQRRKCEACKHCVITPATQGTVSVHCTWGQEADAPANRNYSCSWARSEGGPCGPKAARFEPR